MIKEHSLAIKILMEEVYKIGGKLFADAAIRQLIEAGSNKEAKEELKVVDFARDLLQDRFYGLEGEDKFRSLVNTIALLTELQTDKVIDKCK